MKATIDIPDELHRRVKAKAAIEGRSIREVAIELFTAWLIEAARRGATDQPVAMGEPGRSWLARWQEIDAASTDLTLPSEEIIRERR